VLRFLSHDLDSSFQVSQWSRYVSLSAKEKNKNLPWEASGPTKVFGQQHQHGIAMSRMMKRKKSCSIK